MIRRRGILLAAAFLALPIMAEARPQACMIAADDAARMRCDIDLAVRLLDTADRLHGPAPSPVRLEIIDTTSPSGSAYVYAVFEEGGRTLLEARTVPEGANGAAACRLRTHVPDDTANQIAIAMTTLRASDLPAYGPREEVTLNPDGSRNVRLIIDSHDVITRLHDTEDMIQFSRHARAGDDVTHLNNLVIGVANRSSGWSCNAS